MITEALARMEGLLGQWEEHEDRRAVFLDCYARMTRAMCASLDDETFDDPAWVSELLDRFAVHYFDAVERWDAGGDDVPTPWGIAFEAAAAGDRSVLQLLLVGVNAHINYDLVLTLVELLDPVWGELDAELLASRRRDYDRVNDVIAATADEVQDMVVERHAPRLDIVDTMFGRADEWMAVRLLSSWREDVWRHASSLLDGDAASRPQRLDRRARGCVRRSRIILVRA
ncbi:MAG: hypothetical protein KF906_07125 [Actinobacteria bacterium]|nr:hypothetical protein [Actinomycetota bacterium]